MKIDFYSRTNQFIVDGLVFASSFVAAYAIAFEQWPSGANLRQLLLWLPILVTARLAVHYAMGMYRLVWRFVSFSDAIELAKSIAVVSTILTALRLFVPGEHPVRSVGQASFERHCAGGITIAHRLNGDTIVETASLFLPEKICVRVWAARQKGHSVWGRQGRNHAQ